ncbi:MAG: hemerythrin family protein [Rhodoferax sp.]|uniref:bacteriohemerythrin n=1 Tax=Rhodoferax sp. TaxID=50421 RepID=UPI00181D0EB3|nr:bacteriohemerythrin [Rhodoferax sp.]NMM15022.1 hemerythrin family protein [Rhodoferax sp.]NMM21473.1 hemerythrin family protein [Rhodoferax sp.]
MAYFEWADDLVIDNGPIDRDHRHLVDLVNELHTATTQGCGQEVVAKILNSLVQYTAEHLRMEEQEMAAVHFPHLERHKIGHLKFTESLRDLQQKYDAGSITVASQLSTVLRDWLSLHIRRSDKELLTFMKKSGKK